MRPTLLKSFIVVTLFWFIVTALWWSVQDPSVNLSALAALKQLFPFLPVTVPQDPSIMGSLGVQAKVLGFWTIPVLGGTVVSAAIGYGVMWAKARTKHVERAERETGRGNYRGLTLTVGTLPEPVRLPKDDIELGDDSEALARMTPPQKQLLADILGTISAQPNAFAGEGVSDSLLDHTLQLAARALESPRNPGLCALVVSAHELGKLTAYRQVDGGWECFKNQDVEASKILGLLDSWFVLPALERNAVMMAVKYYSSPKNLPEFESDNSVYQLAFDLLNKSEQAATVVLEEAKTQTLEKSSGSLSDSLFDTLIETLPLLSFQNRGLPKGVPAVAWKMKNRVYLLEIKLRETVTSKLPPDLKGALTGSRDKARLQPFTSELLKALHQKGWLVTQVGDHKVDPKEALWNIKAGKLEFKGVIIIDVPPEHMSALPESDSMYELQVTGPLFTGGGSGGGGSPAISKEDLFGDVLKPAPRSDSPV